MRRVEVPNNTPEQVRGYIEDAITLVELLEPPQDLREAVFTVAANLLSGKQILMEQPQPVDLGLLQRSDKLLRS